MSDIIILGGDHNGVQLKKKAKSLLQALGHLCVDVGPFDSSIPVDYVDYARQVGEIIANGDGNLGVLICGTGIGMSIAVNKIEKVRAALVHNLISAEKSREHNDANILCLGSWVNEDENNLELLQSWLNSRFGQYRHVKRVEKLERNHEESLVFTNGVFDILHKGHIQLLQFAKSLGKRLVVGINSDLSTRKLKGEGRPINSEENRKAVLQSLACVDEVVIFNELQPTQLINILQPDIVVKGGEWTAEEVRERDRISHSIQVKVFPMVEGFSTTGMLKNIKAKTSVEKELYTS